ncbi:CPBP family intramembrane glutamic endopeptidase [Pseudolysinimonas sp.]
MSDVLPPPTPTTAPEPEIAVVQVPYHRLFRAQPNYRWWRPFVAVILLIVFIIVAQLILVAAVMVALFASGTLVVTGPQDAVALQNAVLAYFLPDAANPISLVISLGSIAVWLPLVPLALRCAGIRPAGLRTNPVHSVLLRLRWRWLAWCFLPSILVIGISLVIPIGFGLAAGEPLGEFTTPPATYALSLLIILLIVPLQSSAEEYVFRGVLFQAIGSWLRWVPVALIVTTLLFVSLHIYDIWGLLDVATFAVAAIVVTWRTGGLEAAIALHIVNNVASLALMGTGMFGPTGVTAEGGSPVGVALSAVTMGLYVLLIFRRAPKAGIEQLSRIGVPVLPGIPTPPTR